MHNAGLARNWFLDVIAEMAQPAVPGLDQSFEALVLAVTNKQKREWPLPSVDRRNASGGASVSNCQA